MEHFEQKRNTLLQKLRLHGIHNETVLDAMQRVERHLFVPEHMLPYAYEDNALPIAAGQTISQPWIVAYMLEQLLSCQLKRVLDVGTGSGYMAALLGALGLEVYTVERIDELYQNAKQVLEQFPFTKNVHCILSDGTEGLPEYAPFDGIIVSAADQDIPAAYLPQLVEGGVLVIPLTLDQDNVFLFRCEKKSNTWIKHQLIAVRFVPLIHGDLS